MGIPNESRSTTHLRAFTTYHLAALGADPACAHLIAGTEQSLNAVTAAFATREIAERNELNGQALFLRKDFDLDEATRRVELLVLSASGKDRQSSGYRAAFPRGLSGLVGLRGKAQLDATLAFTAVLRQRFPEVGEQNALALEQLAKTAVEAEDVWRAAERAARTAMTEEQIARTELVRQLHSNRGALRALYPRNAGRVATYFPPVYSRAAGDADETEATADGESGS